ncbi:tetratricopeptide repeat protein [Candidatus Entotheonella palauensis]|uniref:Uncharacterized protein n=1 Tax=Candidatus Entotheonella gemina TaxID=1429439 RepID=W4MG86_9BACT|nr:tetratricopeptide repeat protein [Candidatus Entotheonella palauensis]ETX09213.1 MAG: hypothetical protein ETSY2_00815 [Candidatus Entotheonella gemina]
MKLFAWKIGLAILGVLVLLSGCGGSGEDKEVTEADIKKAQELLEKGNDFAAQGAARAEDAVKAYKDAIVVNPKYAEAYNALGLVQRGRQQFREARQSFEKAIELNAQYAEAYKNLGFAYYVDGILDKAIDNYKKAIDNNAEYGEAHYYLGKAYVGQGKLSEARDHIRKSKALGFTPDS